MANTTDIMIVNFCEAKAIDFIRERSGLDFQLVSNGLKCGGDKVQAIEAYGYCARCLGEEAINTLIDIFNEAPFDFPEFAVMVILDDNEDFNGVVTRGGKA